MTSVLYKVAVVIPCFRVSQLVGVVVRDVLRIAEQLSAHYELTIFVVNDACPQESWREIPSHPRVQILHHSQNSGVGAATLTGFQAALDQECDALVKLDADGQHPAMYLFDLIPHIFSQPDSELALVKGSRYRWPNPPGAIPWARKFGSILLEPMARAALACRNLTDISNGYLAMNGLSASYLLSRGLGPPLQLRYTFESSVLVRCSWFGFFARLAF